MDVLTSPRDSQDPEYDIEKDYRRDEMLRHTDYSELKLELRSRGLRTSGDKVEMMVRILLHTIDPTIDFKELSGVGANLTYVTDEDMKSGKVRLTTLEEREAAKKM